VHHQRQLREHLQHPDAPRQPQQAEHAEEAEGRRTWVVPLASVEGIEGQHEDIRENEQEVQDIHLAVKELHAEGVQSCGHFQGVKRQKRVIGCLDPLEGRHLCRGPVGLHGDQGQIEGNGHGQHALRPVARQDLAQPSVDAVRWRVRVTLQRPRRVVRSHGSRHGFALPFQT